MGECNRCTLNHIKESKAPGSKIVTRDDDGGVSVYEVPEGMQIDKVNDKIAWFMALSDKCEC